MKYQINESDGSTSASVPQQLCLELADELADTFVRIAE